jgi:hypothetical protein
VLWLSSQSSKNLSSNIVSSPKNLKSPSNHNTPYQKTTPQLTPWGGLHFIKVKSTSPLTPSKGGDLIFAPLGRGKP